ncbi:glycoside hydrolase family 127 protein [Flectobacillus sp. DC10W]|uniref:Glycoside hydrolase family 127 protein n=1 Tax=Flectobacillus longus TaxID=2984207 RepID=A0ABT6YMG7_9BACT|nr:beta-L-arabinofuranosidase domain-containing protein [Flectobacillus longus]MDI9864373.1 glycoside hydrolase family 127 protein [Flectobacillus longus]
MKKRTTTWLAVLCFLASYCLQAQSNYYQPLPLGTIKPKGWLREMLLTQKNGSTGKLDELYPLVMGQRNGWLGGDGDQWERGPYWIDGLLPLAYILDDKELIAKVKPWIEWSIKSQQPNGYFGPSKDYDYEAGIQRDNSHDWWPKMVMLKILQQYYSATQDKRVLTLMSNYFRFQLKELPQKPLDHWTFWAKFRVADNLMAVYWLYDITHEPFLLDLGELLHKQSFDFTHQFLQTDFLTHFGSIHTVNLAQGLKEPIIYYQKHQEAKYLEAVKKGLIDIRHYNGFANGGYGGDEALHGNNPTQGTELCTIVEMMFSLEKALEITGDISFADQLEKLAFNALPTQITDDFMERQYFQQANQVMATRHQRNFGDNHGGTDLCFGLLTGYPCCTSNMHQGWPKFTQNLWYTTADKGIAALVYSSNEMKTLVGENTMLAVLEETNYPFDESIKFTLSLNKSDSFPFHLRIPAWCKKAIVKVNGKDFQEIEGNQIVKLNRIWKNGDIVELILPMHIFKNKWFENSLSIERGPITYALKIGEESKRIINTKDSKIYGESYIESRPTTDWNFGIFEMPDSKLESFFITTKSNHILSYPWNTQNAPITIRTKAKKIPTWTLYNESAGHLPYSPIYGLEASNLEEDIELIPYGCTTLRISQFPVVGTK